MKNLFPNWSNYVVNFINFLVALFGVLDFTVEQNRFEKVCLKLREYFLNFIYFLMILKTL